MTVDNRYDRQMRDDDLYRPVFHITPPQGWLNDPNAPLKVNDTYHLFYQHNPEKPEWGNIHWGHVQTENLVTWEDRPVALTPENEGIDTDGCWSGCGIIDDGTPTLFYTGVDNGVQRQALAVATNSTLSTWRQDPANPVIAKPPPDVADDEFRDPFVHRVDSEWQAFIGAHSSTVGGCVLVYRSLDLREWQYGGRLFDETAADLRQPDDDGTVWECPLLVEFDKGALLIISEMETRNVRYWVGQLVDTRFYPDHGGILDAGDFYAPNVLDDGDRTLLWGWLPEAREPPGIDSWNGALSIPREVTLDRNNQLLVRPAHELHALRRESRIGSISSVTPVQTEHIDHPRGAAWEMATTIEMGRATAIEWILRSQSPDPEETIIRLDQAEERVIIDRSAASNHEWADASVIEAPVTFASDTTDIRLFFDHSIIEVFLNDRYCLTSRIYPVHNDDHTILLTAIGGESEVIDWTVWSLDSIWETPHTEDPPT